MSIDKGAGQSPWWYSDGGDEGWNPTPRTVSNSRIGVSLIKHHENCPCWFCDESDHRLWEVPCGCDVCRAKRSGDNDVCSGESRGDFVSFPLGSRVRRQQGTTAVGDSIVWGTTGRVVGYDQYSLRVDWDLPGPRTVSARYTPHQLDSLLLITKDSMHWTSVMDREEALLEAKEVAKSAPRKPMNDHQKTTWADDGGNTKNIMVVMDTGVSPPSSSPIVEQPEILAMRESLRAMNVQLQRLTELSKSTDSLSAALNEGLV